MKILVYGALTDAGAKVLSDAGMEYVIPAEPVKGHDNWAQLEKIDEKTRSEISAMIGQAINTDEKLLLLLPNLKWVHNMGAGLTGATGKGVDWELVNRRGIAVTAAKFHDKIVSELAITLLVTLMKHIMHFQKNKEQHLYVPAAQSPKVTLMDGATALVIGTGVIGAEIGRKLSVGFGMKVYGISRSGKPVEHFEAVYPMDQLDELLPKADAVILACAYTPETEGLIDARRLSLMKRSAYLVNIARGQVVVQDDLTRALNDGIIAGAGLDVYRQEPMPADDPLWDAKNLVSTPHIGGLFPAYNENVMKTFVKNSVAFLAGHPEEMPDYANIKGY